MIAIGRQRLVPWRHPVPALQPASVCICGSDAGHAAATQYRLVVTAAEAVTERMRKLGTWLDEYPTGTLRRLGQLCVSGPATPESLRTDGLL